MNGLIIAEPWISCIINGHKTWEMRSRNTRMRGRIALIRKGSKTVVGVADLVCTLPKLSQAKLRECVDKHRVPENQIGEDFKHNTAWVLERARSLSRPVPYLHSAGAVIWIKLDAEVTAAIERQLGDI